MSKFCWAAVMQQCLFVRNGSPTGLVNPAHINGRSPISLDTLSSLSQGGTAPKLEFRVIHIHLCCKPSIPNV
jgi:hypothetical protein